METSKDAEFLQGLIFGVFDDFDAYMLNEAKTAAKRFKVFSNDGIDEYQQGGELANLIRRYFNTKIELLDGLNNLSRDGRIRLDLTWLVYENAFNSLISELFQKNLSLLFRELFKGLSGAEFQNKDFINDVRRQNLKDKGKFAKDFQALIDDYIAKNKDDAEVFLKRVKSLSKAGKELFKECGADINKILKNYKNR